MRQSTPLSAVLRKFMLLGLIAGCHAPEANEVVGERSLEAPLVSSTASLTSARYDHTVTVLSNGKVLAVGGQGASGKLASSELYDPATGTWSPTGSLGTARSAHSAVRLNDGTVLVAGGIGASILSSVERYNPATGTWSTMPSLAAASWSHTATLLQDGRVLVTGGCPSPLSAAAQIFDPASNTWSTTGSMNLPRCRHRATLLADGRVLITGGTNLQADSHRAEIFNPATGTFTLTAPANTYKWPHEATRLADGRVLLLANWSTTGNEIYDPATNTWSTAAMPVDQRSYQAALLMSDGSTLVAGGTSSSIERYSGGAWSVVGHTMGERQSPGVAVLQDGSVMLVGGSYTQWTPASGGWSGTPAPLATTEIYRPTLSQLAVYDPVLRVPKCATAQVECDSQSLLHGRGTVGPEANQPNTLGGTCADGTGGNLNDESLRALRVRSSSGTLMQAGQQVIIQATVVGSTTGASTDVLDIFHAADANAPSWQLVASLPLTPAMSGLRDLSTTFTLPAGSLQAIRGSFRRGGTAVACSTGVYDDHDDLVFAVSAGGGGADTTPPTVAFTSPTAGALLGGTVFVRATASDNVGVTRVEFLQGSTVLFTDAAAPYEFYWGAYNGPNTLTARAYDGAGNVGTASVSFTADRVAPTVSITSPASGGTVSGTVTVSASATDNTSVSSVSFYANGALIGTDTTAPYGVSWNTTGLGGSLVLSAVAVDAVGNSASSASVTVSVGPGGASYDAGLRTASCASVGPVCDSQGLFVGRGGVGPELNAPNTIGATCADDSTGTFHSDESLDRIRVSTADGTNLRVGSTVTVQATVWAWSGYSSDTLDLFYAADATNPTWVQFATLTPTTSGPSTLTATYTLPAGALQAIRGQFRYGSNTGPCAAGAYNDRDDLVFAVAP